MKSVREICKKSCQFEMGGALGVANITVLYFIFSEKHCNDKK